MLRSKQRAPGRLCHVESPSIVEGDAILSPLMPITNEEDRSLESTESSWATFKYIDMKFAIISKLFFLFGSSVQLFTALASLKATQADWMLNDDIPEDDNYTLTASDFTYYVMYSLGPFLYAINSYFEIRFSLEVLTWSAIRSMWNRNEIILFHETEEGSLPQNHRHIEIELLHQVDNNNAGESEYREVEIRSRNSDLLSENPSNVSNHLVRVLVGMIFGAGALTELYSTLLDDHYEDEDGWDDDAYLIDNEHKRHWYVSNYRMSFIAMHLYLISGMIQLMFQSDLHRSFCQVRCIGRRMCCKHIQDDVSNESRQAMDSLTYYLMLWGTILFVCGTLLDCLIAWLSDPLIRQRLDPTKSVLWDFSGLTLAKFDVISSVMWSADAIMYLSADIMIYRLCSRESNARAWLFENILTCKTRDNISLGRSTNH